MFCKSKWTTLTWIFRYNDLTPNTILKKASPLLIDATLIFLKNWWSLTLTPEKLIGLIQNLTIFTVLLCMVTWKLWYILKKSIRKLKVLNVMVACCGQCEATAVLELTDWKLLFWVNVWIYLLHFTLHIYSFLGLNIFTQNIWPT